MNGYELLWTEQLTRAIGWTIVHSIWQATLITLVVKYYLRIHPRYTTNTRYLILTSGLVSIFLLAAATFGIVGATASPVVATPTIDVTRQVYTPVANDGAAFTWPILQNNLNSILPYLVNFWLIGMGLFLLRFLAGTAWLYRIKYFQSWPVPPSAASRMGCQVR